MELTVEILSKPDCHLCEEAKSVIAQVRQARAFRLSEVDITADPQLYERYKEEIPVIFINGQKAFKYRLTYEALDKRLARISQATPSQPPGNLDHP